ncbi:nucleotide-binding protein [Vibrio cholerae]|uniref:TIR domain-containing protein n=1 Tax=Vibrio cholerae TaxID=666 RepID=UPI0005B3EE2C|nr:nucleotide-binding protein [Vibrio cholerae]EJH6267030.1 nucleotide-binding protein [Vibrio cholerae]EJV3735336.1 nucleotide-binding protein [Vibrio cholerae]EKF9216555.1 nucleotide-binding protein [Vibrio cholerae]EMC3732785.1 nucleotide-binding protein [Vibrio cholerae]MBO1386605.1 DNA-binding protein [Vibrio cholerae]
MFNLIISSDPETWDLTPYQCDRSRAIVEYTADEISERYKFFDKNAIEELKSFPTLFVTENESVESRIGYITEIRVRNNSVVINYEFDPILPSLPIGAIEAMRVDIDLGRFELSRTHWAVKDEPIFEILMRHGYLNQAQVNAAIQRRMPPPPVLKPDSHDEKGFNTSQVFIVHGHDDIAKLDVANFITSLGLQPIILHMQASSGMTIIEKIEHYSNVGFGIVLYTPCDTGAKVGALSGRYRARQNVVFEHGYLIGKLGRPRVCAVVKGDIETPNDISGVVYVGMDASLGWQDQLKLEMRNVGYNV